MDAYNISPLYDLLHSVWPSLGPSKLLQMALFILFNGWVIIHCVCQCRICKKRGFDPCISKVPWRRKWQLAPVFLPGKFHRGAWQVTVLGFAKSQTWLSTHTVFHCIYVLHFLYPFLCRWAFRLSFRVQSLPPKTSASFMKLVNHANTLAPLQTHLNRISRVFKASSRYKWRWF